MSIEHRLQHHWRDFHVENATARLKSQTIGVNDISYWVQTRLNFMHNVQCAFYSVTMHDRKSMCEWYWSFEKSVWREFNALGRFAEEPVENMTRFYEKKKNSMTHCIHHIKFNVPRLHSLKSCHYFVKELSYWIALDAFIEWKSQIRNENEM